MCVLAIFVFIFSFFFLVAYGLRCSKLVSFSLFFYRDCVNVVEHEKSVSPAYKIFPVCIPQSVRVFFFCISSTTIYFYFCYLCSISLHSISNIILYKPCRVFHIYPIKMRDVYSIVCVQSDCKSNRKNQQRNRFPAYVNLIQMNSHFRTMEM